jgi:outer membrane lipoprotein
MNWTRLLTLGLMAPLIFVSACNRYNVIPENLEKQVNRTISFDQLKESPSTYKGNILVLGGEVISAKRLEDRTRVEVLQLPLNEDYIPIPKRGESNGRFLAFDRGKEILDPAILKEGTPVTIVGEVVGGTPGSIGESKYEYPTLNIKDLTVWDKDRIQGQNQPYPYYYGYYWYGYRPYYFW